MARRGECPGRWDGEAPECGLRPSWAQIPEQTGPEFQLSMWDEPWEGSAVVTCSQLKSTYTIKKATSAASDLCLGILETRFLKERKCLNKRTVSHS